MADSDLLFSRQPLGNPADLVFGDSDAGGDDAHVEGVVHLPALSLSGHVRAGARVAGVAVLPALSIIGTVAYRSNTQRPLVGQATVRWQDARRQGERIGQRWQGGQRMPAYVETGAERGIGLQVDTRTHWRDADRTSRREVRARFQDGIALPLGVGSAVGDGRRGMGPSVVARYQQAQQLHAASEQRFQEALRGVAGDHRMHYQEAIRMPGYWLSLVGAGRRVSRGWGTRYQDAVQPRPGRTNLHPVEPPVDPCYVPNGDLVFDTPWTGDSDLVFICERHGPLPGDTIEIGRAHV